MSIKPSELILNSDGSVYHLNLKPNDIADTIIFVGDQYRVEAVTKHFDRIDVSRQKREFKTQTGVYKGKRLSVISTGIGPDNIDIVLNELDALVNIDFETRLPKSKLKSLNIIRIGTSGAIQPEIPVDSFLLSTYGLDINGMLHAYQIDTIQHPEIEHALIQQTAWYEHRAKPIFIANDHRLQAVFESSETVKGVTATAGGFYGPQCRSLRLALKDETLYEKLKNFKYNNITITNLEMETSAIYGLSKLLGHKAVSLNAILANRATDAFSEKPQQTVDDLILYALERIIKI